MGKVVVWCPIKQGITPWIELICIKIKHGYIHGEGDYLVSSPNVSSSFNSIYFTIYKI